MAKCKCCDKEALEGCEYCASCKEEHNHGWKAVWKCVGGVAVVVGVVLGAILKGGDSSSKA